MAAATGLDVDTFVERYWAGRLAFDLGLDSASYWSALAGRSLGPVEVARLDEVDVASWLHPEQGTVDLVGELVARGTQVALLSNAPLSLALAIDRLEWTKPVSPRIYSSRLGVAKPRPAAYLAVLESAGVEAGEAVFVDDRPVNVAGAERVGIPGIVFSTAEDVAHRLGIG
jgi:putative hydrolase of the HAD superfamily